ncbi:tetratricopeptide repeat protein [Streptomyces sp. NPDC030920]|uniref:tetratricopeptide repeat protein n=1 Tax=Streptomyces sp. NPDC030920 TaxID=3365308 RepID=UPI00384CAA2C
MSDREWRLWRPVDPIDAETALAESSRVGPRTVVWLNESQRFLDAGGGRGERIAAGLRRLLSAPECAPVLVLGTLWPVHANRYSAAPQHDAGDLHVHARELLAGRLLIVPDQFDHAAMDKAERLAADGDQQLAHALRHVTGGQLTQFLAGAPELVRRYRSVSPKARAVIHAAIDARRLGTGQDLPLAFLAQAAEDYLTDAEYDLLDDDWVDQAVTESTGPVRGYLAPLRVMRPRRSGYTTEEQQSPPDVHLRLADYLEQIGRLERWPLCPPESFWAAAHGLLTNADDLAQLANAAANRHRSYWATQLTVQAGSLGEPSALLHFAHALRRSGRHDVAEELYSKAAQTGFEHAQASLVENREQAGEANEAERLARVSASREGAMALERLAILRGEKGDIVSAVRLAREAATMGHTYGLVSVSAMCDRGGDSDTAEVLAWEAAAIGEPAALVSLVTQRVETSRDDEAYRLACQAAETGEPACMIILGLFWAEAGHRAAARELYEQTLRMCPIGVGTSALQLNIHATMLTALGESDQAEELYEQAAELGHRDSRFSLMAIRERSGDHAEAEAMARQAAEAGDPGFLLDLAELRGAAGDSIAAEALAWEAAGYGYPLALAHLARMAEETGDTAEAESRALLATNAGDVNAIRFLRETRARFWPHGLEPDGTPSGPW